MVIHDEDSDAWKGLSHSQLLLATRKEPSTPAENFPIAAFMRTYQYRCQDSDGGLHEGLLDAKSRDAARALLQERGWGILSLSHGFRASVAAAEPPPQSETARPCAAPTPEVTWRPQQLCLFTLQLGTLLGSGVGIVRALECLSQGQEPRVVRVVAGIQMRVLQGEGLSAAMRRFPGVFSPSYQAMVRLGEDTGALVTIVRRMAESLRRSESHRTRLLATLTYPLFLIASVGLMCLLLTVYMVPQLNHLLLGMGVELPFLTRAVVALSDARAVLLGATCAALLGLWLWAARRTPSGRMLLERLRFELPGLGPIMRRSLEVRLARGLALMLDSGMSWTQAAALLATPSCGYEGYDHSLRQLQREVEAGDFRGAIEHCQAFSPLLSGLVLAGAEANKVTRFLESYADLSEVELEVTLESLLRLLEPAVLLVLGGFVGVVVVASFLPVYQLLLTL